MVLSLYTALKARHSPGWIWGRVPKDFALTTNLILLQKYNIAKYSAFIKCVV